MQIPSFRFLKLAAKISYKDLATVVALVAGLSIAFITTPSVASIFKVIDGEYKLPASLDETVSTKRQTELWAHVWRPDQSGPYPLVVFLHGNHATCGKVVTELGFREDDNIDYTEHGTCPEGYVVTPSHLGYAYLAKSLAKYGFVVVSINSNRGINGADGERKDVGLNLLRGRLVLRHLQELSKWNNRGGAPASLGFPMKGLIDFTQVGLMGHSRGGEGMRAAVNQFNETGSLWPKRIKKLKFRSLFEIGPVDGQTSRILNPVGLVWNVLLPGCDGDVSDLQGVKPFDRMLQDTSEKQSFRSSTFQVFGANHNFYNTEWQLSDSSGCRGQTPLFPYLSGSAAQRRTALNTLIPFFRSNLGKTPIPVLADRFDPSYPLPKSLLADSSYARGFNATSRASENFVIDNFDRETGISSQGRATEVSGLSQYEHKAFELTHDATQRSAVIKWDQAGGFIQVNAASTKGTNINGYQALEFRVALSCFDELCNNKTNPTGDLDFSISLADATTPLSEPVTLKSYAAVHRPGGSWLFSPSVYVSTDILQTVRIPLSAFNNVDLSHFVGVRFTFDRSAKSSIYLANVRLTKTPAGPGTLTAGVSNIQTKVLIPPSLQREGQMDENQVVAIRHLSSEVAKAESPATVEIEISSTRPFPVGGALAVLNIGKQSFKLSRYVSGDLHRMIFTLDEDEYATTRQGEEMTVHIGNAQPWKFGALDKSLSN